MGVLTVICVLFYEGSIYVQRNLISLVQQTIITAAIIDHMNRGAKKLSVKQVTANDLV